MIAVENLSVRAGAFRLDGVSFTVAAGEYAVLMGKTGSGKTTLLEAMCGLKTVRAGRILLHDRDVTGWLRKNLGAA
jgi:molybdate/tungstate transport system ATP-binding protein